MTGSPAVIGFDRLATDQHALVGGKCASLGTMSQVGLPVPPGFAVTTEVFTDARAASGSRQRLTEIVDGGLGGFDVVPQDALTEVAVRARELVMSWTLPKVHEDRIRETVRRAVRPLRRRRRARRGPLVGHGRGLTRRVLRR